MSSIKRILIVEDEPLISMMLEDFVDALGHALAGTADSLADALVFAGKGEFDIAILDVNLRGGEKSWPVADLLAEAGKAFVLASGGSADSTPDRHAQAPVLAKPFTMDAVRIALARFD